MPKVKRDKMILHHQKKKMKMKMEVKKMQKKLQKNKKNKNARMKKLSNLKQCSTKIVRVWPSRAKCRSGIQNNAVYKKRREF